MMRAGMTMWRRFGVVCVLLKNKGQEEFRTLGLVLFILPLPPYTKKKAARAESFLL